MINAPFLSICRHSVLAGLILLVVNLMHTCKEFLMLVRLAKNALMFEKNRGADLGGV